MRRDALPKFMPLEQRRNAKAKGKSRWERAGRTLCSGMGADKVASGTEGERLWQKQEARSNFKYFRYLLV